VAKENGGLIIPLDGLAPEGGEPQLWFIRELLSGVTLGSGWMTQQDHTAFESFLKPLKKLPWPILAVLSDKQTGLAPAIATVLPKSKHQFCQAHYLGNLAKPLIQDDSTLCVEIRKAVRGEIGKLILAQESIDPSNPGLLTVTGLLPSTLNPPATQLDHHQIKNSEQMSPSAIESSSEYQPNEQIKDEPKALPPANAVVACSTHTLNHPPVQPEIPGNSSKSNHISGVMAIASKLLHPIKSLKNAIQSISSSFNRKNAICDSFTEHKSLKSADPGSVSSEIKKPVTAFPVSFPQNSAIVADSIVIQLLRRIGYLLTLKSRKPFIFAGIQTFDRLKDLTHIIDLMLLHRHDPILLQLSLGIKQALSPLEGQKQQLAVQASWLRSISDILDSPKDHKTSATQVTRKLRKYLDNLLLLTDLSPSQEAFRLHLNTVSNSYWSGLFHCYDMEKLPRTNNSLESHFRDTQRRLLRTTGQKGQTRRALQRIGAWELLQKSDDKAQCLDNLRKIPRSDLSLEQQRLRLHLERFRLHTRSHQRATSQLEKLLRQWLTLPALPSG